MAFLTSSAIRHVFPSVDRTSAWIPSIRDYIARAYSRRRVLKGRSYDVEVSCYEFSIGAVDPKIVGMYIVSLCRWDLLQIQGYPRGPCL